MLSMVAEWWAAEARQLMVGWLHMPQRQHSDASGSGSSQRQTWAMATSVGAAADTTTDQVMAANAVLFVLTVVWFQLPKGLGIAAGIRCGNALGAVSFLSLFGVVLSGFSLPILSGPLGC